MAFSQPSAAIPHSGRVFHASTETTLVISGVPLGILDDLTDLPRVSQGGPKLTEPELTTRINAFLKKVVIATIKEHPNPQISDEQLQQLQVSARVNSRALSLILQQINAPRDTSRGLVPTWSRSHPFSCWLGVPTKQVRDRVSELLRYKPLCPPKSGGPESLSGRVTGSSMGSNPTDIGVTGTGMETDTGKDGDIQETSDAKSSKPGAGDRAASSSGGGGGTTGSATDIASTPAELMPWFQKHRYKLLKDDAMVYLSGLPGNATAETLHQLCAALKLPSGASFGTSVLLCRVRPPARAPQNLSSATILLDSPDLAQHLIRRLDGAKLRGYETPLRLMPFQPKLRRMVDRLVSLGWKSVFVSGLALDYTAESLIADLEKLTAEGAVKQLKILHSSQGPDDGKFSGKALIIFAQDKDGEALRDSILSAQEEGKPEQVEPLRFVKLEDANVSLYLPPVLRKFLRTHPEAKERLRARIPDHPALQKPKHYIPFHINVEIGNLSPNINEEALLEALLSDEVIQGGTSPDVLRQRIRMRRDRRTGLKRAWVLLPDAHAERIQQRLNGKPSSQLGNVLDDMSGGTGGGGPGLGGGRSPDPRGPGGGGGASGPGSTDESEQVKLTVRLLLPPEERARRHLTRLLASDPSASPDEVASGTSSDPVKDAFGGQSTMGPSPLVMLGHGMPMHPPPFFAGYLHAGAVGRQVYPSAPYAQTGPLPPQPGPAPPSGPVPGVPYLAPGSGLPSGPGGGPGMLAGRRFPAVGAGGFPGRQHTFAAQGPDHPPFAPTQVQQAAHAPTDKVYSYGQPTLHHDNLGPHLGIAREQAIPQHRMMGAEGTARAPLAGTSQAPSAHPSQPVRSGGLRFGSGTTGRGAPPTRPVQPHGMPIHPPSHVMPGQAQGPDPRALPFGSQRQPDEPRYVPPQPAQPARSAQPHQPQDMPPVQGETGIYESTQ